MNDLLGYDRAVVSSRLSQQLWPANSDENRWLLCSLTHSVTASGPDVAIYFKFYRQSSLRNWSQKRGATQILHCRCRSQSSKCNALILSYQKLKKDSSKMKFINSASNRQLRNTQDGPN